MSEISTESKGGNKKGKPKKKSTRVDFTPMVDLGFLLITFFMLTTTLIKPQTMEISMPSKDPVKPGEETKVKASLSITIVLGKNDKVYYYLGTTEKGINPKAVETNFGSDGIRKILLERNITVMKEIADLKDQKAKKLISEDTLKARVSRLKSGKNTPVVLIKSSDDATYNNLVDILDEMQICNIGKYAIVDVAKFDLDVIKESGFERPVAGKL